MLRSSWRGSGGSLAEQLATELRSSISTGRIPAGSALPSERDLATRAAVSRTTVSGAVDLLVATGWATRRDRARPLATLPGAKDQPLAPAYTHGADIVDLRPARLAAPADLVNDAIERARSRLTPHLLGDGRTQFGLPELRAAVAQRWTASGLATNADQVLITNGAMGAFHACLEMHPGTVMVEDPTYHVAVRLIGQKRRPVIAWPRGQHWDVDHLRALTRKTPPALAYVVPDFHNPTGALVGQAERDAFAIEAQRLNGTTFVIDETLRELDLRESGSPLPRHTAALLPGAVTIGGLSKTMWSGLRIGWMRLPDKRSIPTAAQFTDFQPVPILDQLIAIELWPHIDEVVDARIARLRVQRDELVARCTNAGLSVASPAGGLACWIDLGRPVATKLTEHLARRGTLLAPGTMFSTTSPHEQFIRVPFTHQPALTAGVIVQIEEFLAARSR